MDGRDVLLDGAHNPAGAAALAQALDDLRPFLTGGDAPARERPPITLVTASMADKDVAGVVRALVAADALRDARIICTSLDMARALPADELAAAWSAEPGGRVVSAQPDVAAALDEALADRSGPGRGGRLALSRGGGSGPARRRPAAARPGGPFRPMTQLPQTDR